MGDAVQFGGELAVVGLSLHHEALATEPVENVSVGLTLAGTAYPVARRLELERLEGKVRDITARLSGSLAMPTGTFKFANGQASWTSSRRSRSRSRCRKVLVREAADQHPARAGAAPAGVRAEGHFTADVGAKIDFADLDALALTGKIGIDGCKVVKAPPEVLALDGKQPGKQSLVVNVEVPKKLGAAAPRKLARPDHEPDVLSVVDRAGQPGLRSLRRDLAVPGRVDHDHRGQRVLQAPRLGQLRSSRARCARTCSAAASGWARRRSPCR